MSFLTQVREQYEENRQNRNWFERAFDWVKDTTSSLGGQRWQQEIERREEQRIRQAELDVNRRNAENKVIEGFDDERAEVDNMRESMLNESRELQQLDPYSDEYRRRLAELNNKRFTFEEKAYKFGGAQASLDDHLARQEYVRFQRWPFSDYFLDQEAMGNFTNKHIAPLMYNEEWEYINTPQANARYAVIANMINSAFSLSNEKVEEMIRRNIIQTPDELYSSDGFNKVIGELATALWESFDNNAATLVNNDGSFDWDRLRTVMMTDDNLKDALDKYQNFVDGIDSIVRTDRKQDAKTAASKVWSRLTQWADFLADDVINSWLNSLSSALWNKNVAFFGDTAQKALIENTAWTETVGRWLLREGLQQPWHILLLGAEIAATFKFGAWLWNMLSRAARFGSVGRRLSPAIRAIDRATDATRINTGWQSFDKAAQAAGTAINYMKKRAPRVADEVIKSIPIDYIVDSWIWEYDNAWLNTLFSGMVGMFVGWRQAYIDQIADSVRRLPDDATRRDYLRSLGIVSEGITDFSRRSIEELAWESLRALSTPEWLQKVLGLGYVSDAIKMTPDRFDLPFYDRLYTSILPNIDSGSSKLVPELDAIAQRARDVLRNESISDADKLSQMQDLTIKMFADIGTNMVAKRMNAKFEEVMASWLIRNLSEVLMSRWGMSQQDAVSTALVAYANSAKSAEDIFKASLEAWARLPMEKANTLADDVAAFGASAEYIQRTPNLISDVASMWQIARRADPETWVDEVLRRTASDIGGDVATAEAISALPSGLRKSYDDMMSLAWEPEKWFLDIARYTSNIKWYIKEGSTPKIIARAWEVLESAQWYVDNVLSFLKWADDAVWYVKSIQDNIDSLFKGIKWFGDEVMQAYNPNKINVFAEWYADRFATITPASLRQTFGDDFVNLHLEIIEKAIKRSHANEDIMKVIFKEYLWYAMNKHLLNPEQYLEDLSRLYARVDLPAEQLAYVQSRQRDVYKFIKHNSDLMYDTLHHQITKAVPADMVDNVVDALQLHRTADNIGMTAYELPEHVVSILANINRGKLNNYQKALLDGMWVAWSYHLPVLDTVVRNIHESITMWTEYVVPMAYLNVNGIDLLKRFFHTDLDKFYDILRRSYDLEVEKLHRTWSTIVTKFSGSVDDVIEWATDMRRLNIYADDGNAQKNFFEVLNDLSPRISEGAEGLGGIWYTPLMTVSKYALRTDPDFRRIFTDWLNDYFINKSNRSPMLREQYETFANAVNMNMDDGIWAVIMKLHDDVVERIRLTSGHNNVDDITDVTHAILYQADEYIRSISSIADTQNRAILDNYEAVVEMVTRTLLDRQSSKDILSVQSVANAVSQISSNNTMKLSLISDISIRNIDVTGMESFLRNYMDGTITGINLSKNDFATFLYRNFWYGMFSGSHSFTGDIYQLYGNYILDKAKAISDSPQLVDEFNSLVGSALYKAKNPKQASAVKDWLKSLMRRNGITEEVIMKEIDDYVDAIMANKSSDLRNTLMEEMMRRFNNKDDVISLTRGSDMEDYLATVESIQRQTDNILDLQQERYANAYSHIVQEDILKIRTVDGSENIEGMRNVSKLAKSLGISKQRAKDLLVNAWVDPDIVKSYINSGKLTPEQIVKVVAWEVNNGNLDISMLLKTDAMRNLLKKQISENVKHLSQTLERGKWFDINKKWEVIVRENKWRSGFREFINSVMTMNSRTLYDEEGAKILADSIAREKTGMVFKAKSSLVTKGKNLSIRWYLYQFTDNLKSAMSKMDIDLPTYKSILSDVFSASNKAELDTVLMKYKHINPEQSKLARILSEYKEDIVAFRKEGMPAVSNFTDINNFSDAINRLRWRWIMFGNEEIWRLQAKYAPRISGASSGTIFSKEFWLWGFNRDMFYGGLFDRTGTITKAWFGAWVSRAAMFLMYNPTQFGKGIQQWVENWKHAQAIVAAHQYDPKIMTEVLDFIRNQLDYNIFKWGKFEIARGAETSFTRVVDEFVQSTSVLYQSDKIAQKEAVHAALSQALYPIFEQFGKKGVDDFVDKIGRYKEFSEKFGVLKEIEFMNKYRMKKHILDKSDNVAADMKIYEDMYQFVKEQYQPFLSKTRASMGTFYAMDNIREFSSSRFIDNNRHLFVFKKWATNKVTEYALRVAEEFNSSSGSNFFAKIVDMPVFNMFMSEVARTLYIWYNADKMTGWDYDLSQFVMDLATPFVSFNMTFGGAISDGWKTAKNYYDFDAGAFRSAVMGVAEGARSFTGTAFLYHDVILRQIENAFATGMSYDSLQDQIVNTLKTLWLSNFADPLVRFWYDQYRGVYMKNEITGDWMSNAVETMFNIKTLDRRKYEDLINKMYQGTNAADGNLGDWLKNMVTRNVPILRSIGSWQPRLWILISSLEDYAHENNLDYWNNRYATQVDYEGTSSLIDKYEWFQLLSRLERADPSYVERFLSGELTEADALSIALEEWEAPENLTTLTKVISMLRYQSGAYGQGMAEWILQEASEWDKKQLEQMFVDILIETTGRSAFNVQSAVDKYLIAVSDLWTNYAVADYLVAMRAWWRDHVKNQFFGTWPESKKREQQVLLNRRSEEYQNYIATIRAWQKEILLSAWDIVMSNNYIGTQLKQDYLSVARDLPFNQERGIATESILSNLVVANDMKHILRRDGYPSDEFMNRFAIITRNNLMQVQNMRWDKKIEWYKNITKVFNQMAWAIDDAGMSPLERSIVMQGLTTTMLPFFSDLAKSSPESFNTIVGILGDDLTRTIDTITNASPLTEQEALEFALNIPYSSGDGTWWRRRVTYAKGIKQDDNVAKIARDLWRVKQAVSDLRFRIAMPRVEMQTPTVNRSRSWGFNFSRVELKPISIDVPEIQVPDAWPAIWGSTRSEDLGKRVSVTSRFSVRRVYRPKKIPRTNYFVRRIK